MSRARGAVERWWRATTRYHGAAPPEDWTMTTPHDPGRRRLLAAASVAPLATLVAACAGIPGAADGPPAPAGVQARRPLGLQRARRLPRSAGLGGDARDPVGEPGRHRDPRLPERSARRLDPRRALDVAGRPRAGRDPRQRDASFRAPLPRWRSPRAGRPLEPVRGQRARAERIHRNHQLLRTGRRLAIGRDARGHVRRDRRARAAAARR